MLKFFYVEADIKYTENSELNEWINPANTCRYEPSDHFRELL